MMRRIPLKLTHSRGGCRVYALTGGPAAGETFIARGRANVQTLARECEARYCAERDLELPLVPGRQVRPGAPGPDADDPMPPCLARHYRREE